MVTVAERSVSGHQRGSTESSSSEVTHDANQVVAIRTALISVSDKQGLADFARGLVAKGVRLLSTGGTRKYLQEQGLEAEELSTYTGFPEMLDGRVKTLHPKVFGGLLARRDIPDHMDAIAAHQIAPIDMVVVNLYPFRETIARPGTTREEAVEQIDIGGPSLIRAAAKNHPHVTVVTRPDQYSSLIQAIESDGGTTLSTRKRLAADAFEHTATYDRAIADYLQASSWESDFPPSITLSFHRRDVLRYGENPHQKGAVYARDGQQAANLIAAKQLSGKELSYNNLLDLDAALSIVRSFSKPAATVIKHNNPCGAAVADKLPHALQKALDGDPVSAFGGVLGMNRPIDVETAEVLCQPGLFIEAIVAPQFTPEAVKILTSRPKWRENVRLMQVGPLEDSPSHWEHRFISGGLLVQEADRHPAIPLQWKTVTETTVADAIWDDIGFAWEMVRHVKSNAIVLAKDTAVVGVGAGQMSRVDSTEIAIEKAGPRASGSILASDAFFPFADSITAAHDAGVVAIIQPGGSRRDDEVIAACNQFRIPMIFTGRRHFKH
jgi:phosphoribosylaminoimidazolecarboxamide formyltransferase / IMP cyclohydrolase